MPTHLPASRLLFVAACAMSLTASCSEPAAHHFQTFTGACDASAAVAISSKLLAVANDEDSIIRIYERDQGGPPVQKLNLSGPLELDPKSPETDIEGAAALGDRVYWITSHARNKEGKARPSRWRFFATRFEIVTDKVDLRLIGQPYKNLLKDLAAAPNLKQFNLAAASRLAPKDRGGLNIEGLAASPEGHLLIAFRNPVPGGRALLVPLKNPDGLISGASAKFGDPILLDLGGSGIRDIALAGGRYLIVAGPYGGGKGNSSLFVWDGKTTRAEIVRRANLAQLNPEAIVFYPDSSPNEVQILSDDSSGKNWGIPCHELKDENAKRFRALRLDLNSR